MSVAATITDVVCDVTHGLRVTVTMSAPSAEDRVYVAVSDPPTFPWFQGETPPFTDGTAVLAISVPTGHAYTVRAVYGESSISTTVEM